MHFFDIRHIRLTNSKLKNRPTNVNRRTVKWIIVHLPPSKQPNQEQEYQRTNDRGRNGAHQTASDGHAQLPEQPTAYKGAQDANNDVAQQSKAVALTDLPGQPARHRPNNEGENQIISTHNIESFR